MGRRVEAPASRAPEYAAACDARSDAIEAAEAALADILEAVPAATAAGFLAVARYACELTDRDEGPAIEGASVAYRTLGALVGRPIFGADLDFAEHEEEV